jgi:hypothetical protein
MSNVSGFVDEGTFVFVLCFVFLFLPFCSHLLFKHLSLIFIVLAHWNNSSQVHMSFCLDTLSRFLANQSFFSLLDSACLVDNLKILILCLVWPDHGSNPWERLHTIIMATRMLGIFSFLCNVLWIIVCPFVLFLLAEGPGGSMSEVVGLPNNWYKPITNTVWVRARLCKLQKLLRRESQSYWWSIRNNNIVFSRFNYTSHTY